MKKYKTVGWVSKLATIIIIKLANQLKIHEETSCFHFKISLFLVISYQAKHFFVEKWHLAPTVLKGKQWLRIRRNTSWWGFIIISYYSACIPENQLDRINFDLVWVHLDLFYRYWQSWSLNKNFRGTIKYLRVNYIFYFQFFNDGNIYVLKEFISLSIHK